MAITVTPKYKPLTYEELVKPLEEYWKDYDAHEEALSNTELAASTLEYIINAEPEGSPLRESYNNFRTKLATATDAIANGVDSSDRALLKELKSTFARDISPIETNYKKLQELISEQRRARQANNSVRFSRDASTISVGELMQNPNLSYESYVGDQITADAVHMLTPLSKVITGISNKQLIPGYDSVLENLGLTIADVQSYLKNPFNPSVKFKKIIDNALKIAVNNSGVQNWGDKAALADAYNFAKQGIYSAIGSVKSQHFRQAKELDSDSNKGGRKEEDPIAGLRGASINWTTSTPTNQSSSSRKAAEKNKDFVTSIYSNPDGKLSTPSHDRAWSYFKEIADDMGINPFNVNYFVQFYYQQEAAVREASKNSRSTDALYHARHDVAKKYAELVGMSPDKLTNTIYDSSDKAKKLVEAYKEVVQEQKKIKEALEPYTKPSPYASNKRSITTVFNTDVLEQARQEAIYQDAKSTKLSHQAIAMYDPAVESKVLKKLAGGIGQLLSTGQIKDVDTEGSIQKIKKTGGKGLYKINYKNGNLTKISSEDTASVKKKLEEGKGSLIFDSIYGLLVAVGGANYAIVGVNQTNAFDQIVSIGHILSDISMENYQAYQKQVHNKKGDMTLLKSPEQMNMDEQTKLYEDLSINNLLVPDGNLQYGYVYLHVPGLRFTNQENHEKLVKIVFTNEGRYLGVSSLEEELYSKNPPSVKTVQRLMNEAGYDLVSDNINLSTSPAPGKGRNTTSQYF